MPPWLITWVCACPSYMSDKRSSASSSPSTRPEVVSGGLFSSKEKKSLLRLSGLRGRKVPLLLLFIVVIVCLPFFVPANQKAPCLNRAPRWRAWMTCRLNERDPFLRGRAAPSPPLPKDPRREAAAATQRRIATTTRTAAQSTATPSSETRRCPRSERWHRSLPRRRLLFRSSRPHGSRVPRLLCMAI